MRRRDFLSQSLGAAGMAPLAAQASQRGLNVLFIAVDDLRPELGCYGNDLIKTPNVDRLAKRSVVFQRAYCQAPVCGPSRASLLTGLRPDTTRVWGNRTHFRETVPDVITLPQCFKQAGYFTQAIGKVLHGNMADPPSWSVPAWPPGGRHAGMQYVDADRLQRMAAAEPDQVWRGPDIPTLVWKKRNSWQAPVVPDNALQDGQVGDRSVESLRRLNDQQFFLAVGFQKPHLPFTAPKRYFDLYDPSELPLPEHTERPAGTPEIAFTRWQELRGYTDIPKEGPLPEGKVRELIHGYYAATSYMDAQVGRVLDELEALELADRTVVMLFGDHGWHLGEQGQWAKTTNFELDARAPLMLHVPGMRTGGRSSDGLVEFVDMFPTLCAACGIEPPAGLDGESMMAMVDDPETPGKDAAFNQLPRPYLADKNWEQMGYSIRTDRYRYTEWVNREGSVVGRELYDLANSGFGTVNLADRSAHRPLIEQLSARVRGTARLRAPRLAP